MLVSVIVTTYNRPDALRAVLGGLFAQTDYGFEVLIADDGSTAPTRALVDAAATAGWVPVAHVWQEDLGFRAGAARNRAAARARGDYRLASAASAASPLHAGVRPPRIDEVGYRVRASF